MRKLPALMLWLYWLCVSLMFAFVSGYYIFIMTQLYRHQELYLYETVREMNCIELGIAIFVGVLVISTFIVQGNKLIGILKGRIG